MYNLRWVLAGIGVVIVMGIYFFGRSETRERKHALKGLSAGPMKANPHMSRVRQVDLIDTEIKVHDTAQSDVYTKNSLNPAQSETLVAEAQSVPDVTLGLDAEDEVEKSLHDEESAVSTVEHASFLEETLAFEVEQEAFAEMDEAVESVLGPDIGDEPIDERTTFSMSGLEEGQKTMDSVHEPFIEDDIVDVEIPPELSELQDDERLETESEIGLEENPRKKEPEQQELVLDIEPLILVLSVMASNDEMFVGKDIRQVLEDENLEFGDMDVFNFYIEDKVHPIFSVASAIEPGVFSLETIDEYETPGLILFSQLPGSIPGAEAFDILLNKSRNIAEKLGGQLCDDKRNRLTEQATTHYRDKIVAFEHDVMLARKKQQK